MWTNCLCFCPQRLNVALNAGQEKKEATFGMIFWHLLYLLGFFLVNNAYMYDYVCVYVYMNSGQVVLVANAPPLDYSFKACESSTAVKRFENPWINLERNYAAVSSLRQRTMHNFFEFPYTRTSSHRKFLGSFNVSAIWGAAEWPQAAICRGEREGAEISMVLHVCCNRNVLNRLGRQMATNRLESTLDFIWYHLIMTLLGGRRCRKWQT